VAEDNHKPKESLFTDGGGQERHITVSSMLYEKKRKPEQRHALPDKVPWIRMQGKWLEQAGFDIHTRVRIRVMFGCLVLTLD
jgi:hypothetical protein